MKRLILIMLLFSSTPAHAGDWFSWDDTNTKLHSAFTLLTVLDYGQTIYISDHPKQYSEMNPNLSAHPTHNEIKKHFIKMYLANTLGVYILPPKASYIFQKFHIIFQTSVSLHNASIGVGFRF
jgi:hypothetical protein